MDLTTVLIFAGFTLAGVLIGWPFGFARGQRHILDQIDGRNRECADRAAERSSARLNHAGIRRGHRTILDGEVIE